MNRTILSAMALVVGVAGSTIATSAQAQTQQDGKLGVAPAQSTAATPIAGKVEDDSPDHERFVGHFAVGYFGISQIPIATATAGTNLPGGTGTSTVTAPIIGLRYWLRRGIGIDAGIGFGYQGGSSTTTVQGGNATTTTTVSNPNNAFGFALHGGVPFALAEGHHYVFEFVPEGTFGFGTNSVHGAPGSPDIGLNGFRLDLGARIGTEIHFGFIGVPELALQASVGLYLDFASTAANQGGNSVSANATSIATTVSGAPWAIFANTISALYYF
jgi:hypothetical protein